MLRARCQRSDHWVVIWRGETDELKEALFTHRGVMVIINKRQQRGGRWWWGAPEGGNGAERAGDARDDRVLL